MAQTADVKVPLSQRLIMKVPLSQRLTKPYDPDLQAKMDQTPRGMAHWSGSGPAGTTCGGCAEWNGYRPKTGKARLQSGSCGAYKRAYTLDAGPRFPSTTPSCARFVDFLVPNEELTPEATASAASEPENAPEEING